MNLRLYVVLATTLFLTSNAAWAQPLSVLVLIANHAQRGLATRIQGQTADLAVRITIQQAVLPANLPDQLEFVKARTTDHQVVIWFENQNGTWVVRVIEAEKMLTRRVQTSGAWSESASTEAVGLVVRTALQGLLNSVTVNENSHTTNKSESVSDSVESPWGLHGDFGWSGLMENSETFHQGIVFRWGANWGAETNKWCANLVFGYFSNTFIRTSLATFHLDRKEIGVLMGHNWQVTDYPPFTWNIGSDFGASVLQFNRATYSTNPGLTSKDNSSFWMFALTPAIRTTWFFSRNWGISATLGADVIVGSVKFDVETASGLTSIASLWPVQPHATLSLAFQWR